MPERHLPRFVKSLLGLLATVLLPAVLLGAPIERKWLTIFEQSYGTEGLYVLEVRPTDAGAASRLELQTVNSAALQFRVQHPDRPVTLEALDELGLLKGVAAERRGTYVWDAEREIFLSNAGPEHSPAIGLVRLLDGNDTIRRRLRQPDPFTRDRWRRLYNDPEAPAQLKNEILLREFVLDHTYFPDVLLYERTQEQLKAINDAVTIYALAQKLAPDAPVTFAELRDSGMFGSLGHVPDNVEFKITTAGAKATGTINGVPIVEGPEGPATVRRNRADALLRKRPDYPPAMALAARFRPPAEAVAMLDKAIMAWPDVPGLRVERMAAEARRQGFNAWTKDMDFLVREFPAAPLLIEVEVAAENGRLSKAPEAHAALMVLLADVRPDLLTHQLMAMRSLERVGKTDAAATIYERLIFANPAWKLALTKPGSSPKAGP